MVLASSDTVIIVAQKLRGKDEADGRYDIPSVLGIDATCIHEEADVRLWRLRYDQFTRSAISFVVNELYVCEYMHEHV
jgi:hypothetical protein